MWKFLLQKFLTIPGLSSSSANSLARPKASISDLKVWQMTKRKLPSETSIDDLENKEGINRMDFADLFL